VKSLGLGGNQKVCFSQYIKKENFQVVSGFLKLDACNLSGFEKDLPHIAKEKVAYYAASALHFSLLGNRFETYSQNRPNDEWISDKDVDNAIKIKAISEREGLKISSLAQRFLFSIKEANRVVMGARKIEQIKSTISDWREGVLPEPIFNEILSLID
jgi:aryl-alcohol dehydrogenase-like predicted oxidoreductase